MGGTSTDNPGNPTAVTSNTAGADQELAANSQNALSRARATEGAWGASNAEKSAAIEPSVARTKKPFDVWVGMTSLSPAFCLGPSNNIVEHFIRSARFYLDTYPTHRGDSLTLTCEPDHTHVSRSWV